MITLAQVFATVLLLLAVSGELSRVRAPRPLLRAVGPCAPLSRWIYVHGPAGSIARVLGE